MNNEELEIKYYSYIDFVKSLKSGLLYNINTDISIISKLIDFAKLCKLNGNESKIDYVFKSFCLYGNMSDCMKITHLSNNEISDIIFYEQSTDINITLLAKALYANSGTKFKDFLEWQVKAILENGEIDIEKEYNKWRR